MIVPILIALVMYLIVIFFGFSYKTTEINWGIISIAVSVAHFILSLEKIEPEETGALIRLGKPIQFLDSGPVFILWPIYELKKEQKTLIQMEFGTLEEDEKQGSGRNTTNEVVDDPVRIAFGTLETVTLTPAEIERYKNDPLSKRTVTDPRIVATFKMKNYMKFLSTIGTIEKAKEQIKDAVVGAFQEYAGTTIVSKAIGEIPLITEKIGLAIRERIADEESDAYSDDPGKNWGLTFEGVQIKSLGLSHTINKAIGDNNAAGFELARRTQLATATKIELTQKGEGDANALRALAYAKADGLTALAEATNNPQAELILKLNSLTEAMQKGQVVLTPVDQSLLTEVFKIAKISGK